MAAASILATFADGYSTNRMLSNLNNYEINPLMGKRPGKGKVFFTLAITEGMVLTLAHYMEDWRYVILGGKTAVNTHWFIHNMNLPKE